MSVNVIVSGLPSDAVFPKLIFSFKGLFKKIDIKKFWIRDLSEGYGMNGKEMTVEFTSNAEARKARGFLDNLPFMYAKVKYQLKAHMAEDRMYNDVKMEEDWGRERRQRAPRQRPRRDRRPPSRSPGYRDETSKLDFEIELLRKQRQVIEEERRLLLEQKKLEMIREHGPSAAREFDDFDAYEPPRKRRYPEPVQAKRPRQRTPPPMHKPPRTRPKGLPLFFQPCKKIIADLKPFIEKDASPEEAGILVKLIRAAIRKKLAVALDGQEYMPTGEIIKLYRDKNPKTGDEQFVSKILANIRASYLTDIKVEKTEKESDTENEKEVNEKTEVNEGQGDQLNDKIPQETPANEETGTDAASDIGTKVKPEPNANQEIGTVADEVSKPPENISEEEPEKVSGEVPDEPKEVTEKVSEEPKRVVEEVSAEPKEVAEEVSEEPKKLVEVSENPVKVSEVSQEPNNGTQENESAEAVAKSNNDAELHDAFGYDEAETVNELTEGDLQDAEDWVDEQ